MKKLVENLSGQVSKIPPIWLMRQAGRYLPEYRKTRSEAGSFLELCYNPELAAEVTLQPIRKYGFDAAILFADILLLPQAMGVDLWFETGEGPKLSKTKSVSDIEKLKPKDDIHDTLAPIYETVKILKDELPKETSLIGFAGAPWTVATYMIAGQGTKDQASARRWMFEDYSGFISLISHIENATIEYLAQQIEAGVEVVKLFDSWAGALPYYYIETVSIAPMQRIFGELKRRYPHIKTIAFPRGIGCAYKMANQPEFDGVAVDSSMSMEYAAKMLNKKCMQGNLDPITLVSGGNVLEVEIKRILDEMHGRPFIFNLGHGITPDANPDNVYQLVDIIRNHK